MTLYITRLRLKKSMLPEVALGGNAYSAHRLLWTAFGDHPERRRDFLYRGFDEKPVPEFLCLSQRMPQDTSHFEIETKPFNPRLTPGLALHFTVRVNPVRTVKANGQRHQRHDVVMDRKKRLDAEGVPRDKRPPLPVLVQEEGERWFQSRAVRWGIEVAPQSLRADGYRILDFIKDGRRELRHIRLAVMDISGTLVVRDPAALQAAVSHGIGPAKGFGCGLLLVRPARL